MARDNKWFRRTTWSEQDREEFLARSRRTRGASNKSQYLRIQAYHLAATRQEPLVRAALELLETLFTEYPLPSEIARALHQAAPCHEQLGDLNKFTDGFRGGGS